MAKPDPTPLELQITAVVRAEEAAQKMDRSELARRSGIPVRSLHTYLTDQRVMSVGQISAIARALGFDGALGLITEANERLKKSNGLEP